MSLTLTHQEEAPGKLVTADQSAHWYSTDGEPFHTVLDSAGNPRSTTLRDVRKLEKEGTFLVPSVTSIVGAVLNKAELNAWREQQVLIAADNNPRQPGESIEDWAPRVIAESRNVTKEAAEFGTAMHEVMERMLELMRDGSRVEVV